jgi:putative aldouronate transport system substrate-binding protein
MLSSKIKDSKNFKAILQYIDWLYYSPAGKTYAQWGVKGTTYTGSDYNFTLEKNVKFDAMGLNPSGKKDLRTDYGFYNGVFLGDAGTGPKKLVTSMMSDEIATWTTAAMKKKAYPTAPATPFDAKTAQQVSLITTPVNDYINAQQLKFIVGDNSMSDWGSFVKTVNKKGMTKFLTIKNKAYKDAQAKN